MVILILFVCLFVCLFNLCFNHLSLIFFSVDFSLFEKRSILNIAEKKEKICMFCWTVSKNIIIFLNFAREFFANNIFFFFSCELFKFANICWPEGGGAGAIDFTTKKYVGKIDNFLFIFPFFS